MPSAESIKKKVVKGTVWSAFEKISMQLVLFVVTVIMARKLGPNAFGVVTMVIVFVDVAQGLVDFGFSQALIRKKDRTQADCSTMFFFNLAVAALMYGVMVVCARPIATFYSQPELEAITPVISTLLIINSLIVVQKSLFTADMNFKTQAKASFFSSLAGGAVGLATVYSGVGLWSIVWFQLAQAASNCIMLWYLSAWRPKLIFSYKSFKEMFSFGSGVALAGLLSTVYNNAYQLVIGKVFDARMLAYYGKAHQFASLLSSNISNIIQRVSYPTLCNVREDKDLLYQSCVKFLRISVFVVFPLMIGLGAVAEPLVYLLLGKEWLYTSRLLSVMCLSFMWYPVQAININILQVMGRTNLFLRIEIIKKVISVLIIVLTIRYGLLVMTWGMVANSIISLVINMYYTGKFLDLGFWKQMRHFMPALCYSFSMGVIVLLTMHFLDNNLLRLIAGVASGVLYYVIITRFTDSADMKSLVGLLQKSRQ